MQFITQVKIYLKLALSTWQVWPTKINFILHKITNNMKYLTIIITFFENHVYVCIIWLV